MNTYETHYDYQYNQIGTIEDRHAQLTNIVRSELAKMENDLDATRYDAQLLHLNNAFNRCENTAEQIEFMERWLRFDSHWR